MLSRETRDRNAASIGSIIKSRRNALGLTQKDLARELDLNYYTMISQIENGYVTLPPGFWLPVAKILQLDPEDWVAQCLEELQPEIHKALFGSAARSTIVEMLRALRAR